MAVEQATHVDTVDARETMNRLPSAPSTLKRGVRAGLRPAAIDPQVVNAISSEVQRMWLASSRPAKRQATAKSGINKFRLYQSEDISVRLEVE